jgi:hypothetical protein
MAPPKIIDERLFVPADGDQARQLYEAIVALPAPIVRPSTARVLLGWLLTLSEKRTDDPAADSQRRDYRRILERLGSPPWGPRNVTGAYIRPAAAAA